MSEEKRRRGRPFKPGMKSIGLRLKEDLILEFYKTAEDEGLNYSTLLENLIRLKIVVDKRLDQENASIESSLLSGQKKLRWLDLL